ncbi:MAG: helix-turn-helix domain-containing protein [Pseudonocardiaceae bacterium]
MAPRDTEDNVTIGTRLRRIRKSRGKSLRVVAGLAGTSYGHLSEIENGKAPLDSLRLIKDLAYALEVAPSELTRLPIPAPANGETDAAVQAVRLALTAVSYDMPGGQALPVAALQARVTAMIDALCRCEREREVGAALPGLIRDLHTSIAAGHDVPELLELAAWLHTQATVSWLRLAGASLDLRSQAVMLARGAAGEHGTAASTGLVAAASTRLMLADGACDLAQAGLDAVTVPTDTLESMQLAGFLALRRTLVAAVDGRPGDGDAPLEYAAELAARTGEGNAYGLGFGPVNVGLYPLHGAVEVGDYERAVSIAEGLNPGAQPNRSRQAECWADYGRALARLRGRQDDAVRALRRAERISPHRVLRDPLARDAIAGLVERSPQGRVGEDLRGLAWRGGAARVIPSGDRSDS